MRRNVLWLLTLISCAVILAVTGLLGPVSLSTTPLRQRTPW